MFLIGHSHLRFKSRVSESSLRIYQDKGSKGEAASTDFAFLCFLKQDAYFPSIPCNLFLNYAPSELKFSRLSKFDCKIYFSKFDQKMVLIRLEQTYDNQFVHNFYANQSKVGKDYG